MRPHRCPVCLGRGLMPRGFYDTDMGARNSAVGDEPCRTCLGKGLIWELEESDVIQPQPTEKGSTQK